MGTKTIKFNKNDVPKLPTNKPAVYKIQTEGGKTNYVGVAKRGRLQDRINEHINAGKITGSKVTIEQTSSINAAMKKEQNINVRSKPKYNKKGK